MPAKLEICIFYLFSSCAHCVAWEKLDSSYLALALLGRYGKTLGSFKLFSLLSLSSPYSIYLRTLILLASALFFFISSCLPLQTRK